MRYIISFLLTSAALPALAEVPRVVTDIPPVHAITAQVMGDLGQPELLLDRGANAHNYQMRPSQAASLADAGLVIWIGPEMTPWMDRALDALSPDVPRLGLLAAKGTFPREFGDTSAHGHADDDHDQAEVAKTDDHVGDDDGHSHTGLDPHAWLDPANAKVWADVIATELSRLDPENAAIYAANAAATQARVAVLDAELESILAPVAGKPFVVYHDAYGYFASHFGLTLLGSVSLGDARSPGAARVRDLAQKIADGSDLCLFPEAQHDPVLIQQMADGTSARIGAALDPSGSTLDPGPDAYDALMRALATNIVACLNG
ncbi:MAG: zinc ABC transporter substrate-binding protein [Paracoccaceae bacterium]